MKKAKFEFILLFHHEYGVAPMCRALGVTRAGHYAWKDRKPSGHDLRDAQLSNLIEEVYVGSRMLYGSPKVYRSLAGRGVRTSRKRVARIMRERGMRGVTRSASRRGRDVEKRASRTSSAPDLVKRDFSACVC